MERTGAIPKIVTKPKVKCKKKIGLVDEIRQPVLMELPIKPKTPADSEALLEGTYSKPEKPPMPTEPVINSRIRIERRMKAVEAMKPKHIKSTADLSCSDRITLEEKITKKMNYPVDKKLYKQLISLKLTERSQPSHTHPVSYGPSVRDREPRLQDYFTPTFGPEYNVSVSITFPPSSSQRYYDGFRIHKLMSSWERPD